MCSHKPNEKESLHNFQEIKIKKPILEYKVTSSIIFGIFEDVLLRAEEEGHKPDDHNILKLLSSFKCTQSWVLGPDP